MEVVSAVVNVCLLFLPAGQDDPPAGVGGARVPGEAVRQLSAEFNKAQHAAVEAARSAKTETERVTAQQAIPDLRQYAKRFLELSRNAKDEATVVPALVWVVQHGVGTPEADEAVRQIGQHHVRSEWIDGACALALGNLGADGERLLRRIVEENPHPRIRGRACLGLAYFKSRRLKSLSRSGATVVDRALIKGLELDLYRQQLKLNSAALAPEIEGWLTRVVDEYPLVLFDADISHGFGFLSNDLGPAAGQILRRVAESHSRQETRWEAECALVYQQMMLASLVADLRSVAVLPPGSKKCAGPAMVAATVSGGEARLLAVDPKALVREIEERLQRLAKHTTEIGEPSPCLSHLIMDSPTLSEYHAGIETLLRRRAEGHPDPRFGAAARRSLALYLAGIAALRPTIDADRAYWVDRLGEERVEQIRQLDHKKVNREVAMLAEDLSRENKEAGRAPDPKIDRLRKSYGETANGRE